MIRCKISKTHQKMGFLWGGFKRQVQHYKNYGYFKEFFDYPLHHTFEYIFTEDLIKAELFARLGVFYFAHPEVLKRELPQSYEVYHDLFGISQSSPHDGAYVRSKVWSASEGLGRWVATTGQTKKMEEMMERALKDNQPIMNWGCLYPPLRKR